MLQNSSLNLSYCIKDREIEIKKWHTHPLYLQIVEKLDECDLIRYAAYRVASKIRILQNYLQVSTLPLTLCAATFTKHRLGSTEGSLLLEISELEAVLYDIYFAAEKNQLGIIDVDNATETMVIFLFNVFDRESTRKVPVLAVKLCIAILCNTTLTNMYKYFYTLIADHNNCVTRRRLKIFLTYLATITEFLQDGSMFGQTLIPAAIEDCFINSPGIVGINEDTFMTWLQSSPPMLSWINTLNRLRSSENAVHNIKCSSCKISPLKGLRYKCMKCIRYTQCQTCYFTARISNSHKLKHPMQEFCQQEDSQEMTNIFMNKLRKLLRCSNDKFETTVASNSTSDLLPRKKSVKNDNSDKTSTADLKSSKSHSIDDQLSGIIKQLEFQRRQLVQQISNIRSENQTQVNQSTLKCLDNHQREIGNQVQKLKLLQTYLQSKSNITLNCIDVESTPMPTVPNQKTQRIHNTTGFDLLSPIALKFDPIHRTHSGSVNETPKRPESVLNITTGTKESEITNLPNNSCIDSLVSCSIQDLSTWIGGKPNVTGLSIPTPPPPTSSQTNVSSVNEISTQDEGSSDLDAVLEKLHEILTNNITFDDAADNNQLLSTVTEVEKMLTTVIEDVEYNCKK